MQHSRGCRMDNLRKFLVARPPIVLFTMVLSLIALILMSMSIYVDHSDLVNRDRQQDWNTLLESFSKLQFCVSGNESIPYVDPLSAISNRAPPGQRSHSPLNGGSVNIISVMTNVRVHLGQQPHQFTSSYLLGFINSRQLGHKGSDYTEKVNVTFHMPSFASLLAQCDSKAVEDKSKPNNHLPCDEVTIPMCVTFQSSAMVFPKSRLPKKCNAREFPRPPTSAWTLYWHSANSIFPHCRNDLYVRPVYQLDPKLTRLLTSQDKLQIRMNLHLCSFVLLTFVTAVVVYASLHGAHIYRSVSRLQSYSEEPDSPIHNLQINKVMDSQE